MKGALGAATLALALTGPLAPFLPTGTGLAAQATGTVSGRVRDAATGQPVPGAQVTVDGRQGATTDTAGRYRIREVRSGPHRLRAAVIGYRPTERDSVNVPGGSGVIVDFALVPQALEMAPLAVEAVSDPVLDPLVTATVQRITRDELRALPVTSVAQAVELAAGAVGESYRGGRLGQQAFVLDGLGIKNRLDASTAQLGLRLPPDLVSDASLVTNGFSARYGQALSGLVSVNTRDAGDRWTGRIAYETDRPLEQGGDLGIDRLAASAEGPVSRGIGVVVAVDAEGRLDADPVRAPPPPDPRDPRAQNPSLLPHNSGERVDAGAKLTALLGARHALRLFGLVSSEQRLLFDPAYKYDETLGPGLRVQGDLLSAHFQRTASPESATPVTLDLRVATVGREFARGALEDQPDYRFGAFTFERYRFAGEDLARALDTAGARAPVPGFTPPDWSEGTAWGVPAFFTGFGPRGEIAWNRLRELRGQLDVVIGAGQADFFVGGELSRQQVQTFHRVQAYLPVGDTVPSASAAEFTPLAAALYAETQFRWDDLGFTIGLRYDQFDPRADLGGPEGSAQPRRTLNPRFAVSTVLRGATFVASWGRFSQAPDYQYLVDAAFDDTARTGRFRRGNPGLGYEQATQYEFSLRARPGSATALRVGAYIKRLEGLVASVPLGLDPDSAIFGNADFGSVKGLEVVFERELRDWWGARLSYVLQQATASASTASAFFRRIQLDTTSGDTTLLLPARVEFPLDYDRRHALVAIGQLRVPDGFGPAIGGVRFLGGLEMAGVLRVSSGLPFSRTNVAGDSLISLPNSYRLPTQSTVDALLRRPVSVARVRGSLYLDVRNLLNRRNVESVRRESGAPQLATDDLAARADAAYAAHPEPIPYESPRYRAWADLDRDGLIQGRAELFPLYLSAAQDFYQPLFGYGPPRVVRLGVELLF